MSAFSRLCVVGWLLCSGTAVALADGIHLNGLSPRALGRGGTNIAHADNGAVLFDNPAGAVFLPGNGLFDVGGNLLLMDFHYSDPANPASSDFGVSGLPSVGIVQKSEDGQFAYGIGVYAPAGFSQGHRMQGPFPFLGDQDYKSFGALVKILPGVAWQVNDRLAVGATLGVGISHVELEGPYTLQNAGFLTGVPTRIDMQGTGATPVFSFGTQYRLTEMTTVGVTYQSESRFRMDGNAVAEVPLLGSARYDADINITWPETLGFGVRHEVDPWNVASLDLVWFNWSQAFDDIGIVLKDADQPLFPNIQETLPLAWRDTLSVKLGWEHKLDAQRTLRAGYVYHRNPIPAATLTPYIQAIFEHAFSLGYGFQWRQWELDASYMFLMSPRVRVENSGIIGGDFDQSSHKAFIHAVGLSAIRRF